jgi:uncharacterized alpha-E superfamily protein
MAWRSALTVTGGAPIFEATGGNLGAFNARRFLTMSEDNPGSIRSCLAAARDNARAARNTIPREAWEAINRAWFNIRDRASPGGTQATLNLVETLQAEIRGFEGALARMLRNEAYWFMRLGSVIERGDNTARLLDVKYYLLLPPGQEVGGTLDRDQWTTILQTVSAGTAYRLIYRRALQPWLIADLLIYRHELPRSLVASAEETVRQGEADRLARRRLAGLEQGTIDSLFDEGLHESLRRLIRENAAIDQAIAQQFRFG